MKIVITGPLQSGKSTVVRRAMDSLGWRQTAGFFTRRQPGGPRGSVLLLETWTGASYVFATRIPHPAPDGRLPYEVDEAVFTGPAIESLSIGPPGGPAVIDELGLVEIETCAFTRAVAGLFRGDDPTLVVIQQRAMDRWMSLIGERQVNRVFEIGPENRDALPGRIEQLFRPGKGPAS